MARNNSNRIANNGNGSDSSAPNGSAPPTTNQDLRAITNPLGQLTTIKLEEDNFLLWKFQVENIILGYSLEEFIYGTCDVPPRLIAGEANPAYVLHQRQDMLLISWLLASISTNYLPQVIGCSSSHQIWTTVEQLFNSQSTAKVMFYKRQIQLLKEDNLSMREYLLKIGRASCRERV